MTTAAAIQHLEPVGRQRRARVLLLVLCLLLVAHGSFFPWLFAPPDSWSQALHQMFVQRLWWSGRGDAIGNVLLFVPVGTLGLLALDGMARPPMARWVYVLLGAGVFAFSLQVVQLWIPQRTAAMSDVLWNCVGTALGLPLATYLRPQIDLFALSRLLAHHVAFLTAMLWLAAQCWPLMPAHSLRHVVAAARPILSGSNLSMSVVATTALSLAVVLALARGVRRRWLFGLLLVALALCGKLLMRHLELTPSHLIGWAAGLVLGQGLLQLPERAAARVAVLFALVGVALAAFHPWQWAAEAGEFHWVPLLAPLQAGRVVHTLELVWVAFWCCALTLGTRTLGWSGTGSAVALTLLLLSIEVAQRWQPAQLADITPVVVPTIWWWVWRRWPPRDM